MNTQSQVLITSVKENSELEITATDGLKNYSLFLQKNAKVHFTDLSKEGNTFLAQLSEGSSLSIENLKINTKFSASKFEIFLNGDGSSFDFKGIAVLNNDERADVSVKVVHFGKDTKSKLILKAVLDGKSRSEQKAFTRVEKTGVGADVKQEIRAAVLHEKALVKMFPNLEVLGCNVKASHAAANFKIDPKELFYFASRGISVKVAKELLLQSFCEGFYTGGNVK